MYNNQSKLDFCAKNLYLNFKQSLFCSKVNQPTYVSLYINKTAFPLAISNKMPGHKSDQGKLHFISLRFFEALFEPSTYGSSDVHEQ